MKLLLLNLFLVALTLPVPVAAETGYDAWLRYASIDDTVARQSYDRLPAVVVAPDDSAVISAARGELLRGVRGMLGRTLRVDTALRENAILLGAFRSIRKLVPSFTTPPDLKEDGYLLKTLKVNGQSHLVVAALNERGALYGAFALLRKIGLGEAIDALDERVEPYALVRMLNHWDNLD